MADIDNICVDGVYIYVQHTFTSIMLIFVKYHLSHAAQKFLKGVEIPCRFPGFC